MSLAGKFNNFTIGEENRISAKDKDHLEKAQELYESALLFYSRVYALYQEQRDKYTEDIVKDFTYNPLLISNMGVLDKVNNINEGFINSIYDYFITEYGIEIEKSLVKQYNPIRHANYEMFTPLNYQPTLDNILDQVGSFSFADLAVQQLKDKMFKACYNKYFDEWNISVKNNVVKYSGCAAREWYGSYKIHKCEFYNNFVEAITRFMYGRKMALIQYPYFDRYEISLDEDDFGWKEYSDGFDEEPKLKAIKFYKNGRFDIKFKTAQDARDFACEWCGYTLV